jgi:hypothetical protein
MRRDYKASQEEKYQAETVRDGPVQTLLTKSPTEIEAWVDATAVDAAGVRKVLKLILRVLVVILRRVVA